MNKKPSIFHLLWLKLTTPYKVDMDASWKEKDWIRYEDVYIQVLKGDKGYDIAWQYDPPNHYPIRDMLTAKETD